METKNFTSQEIENLRNDSEWSEAIKAIQNGAKFNGKVYTKRVGNGKSFDLSIYVEGTYISLGRHFKEYVEEVEQIFLMLIEVREEVSEDSDSTINNKVENYKSIETVNSGLGYHVAKKDLKAAYYHGYDGIENI